MASGGSLARFKDLTLSARHADMAPEEALASGHGFVVYDPTVCGWYLLALEEMAAACRARGRHDEAAEPAARAAAVAREIETVLWWDEGRIFVAYDVSPESRQLTGTGRWACCPPPPTRCCIGTVRTGRRAPPAARRARCGARSASPRARSSPGSGVGSYVQWDGNAVWGATAYWAYLVAARLGRWVEAGRLRDQLTGLIDAHGFREFYDADTGEPGGAGATSGFTWPALALDMTIPSG